MSEKIEETTKPGELSEEELGTVTGGVQPRVSVDGESSDDKHPKE